MIHVWGRCNTRVAIFGVTCCCFFVDPCVVLGFGSSLQRVGYIGCAVCRWIAACVVHLLMYDTCVGAV